MVAVIWVVLFLLAVVWFLWFRRTPMYRAHRRIGVVSGQSGVGGVPGQSGVGNTPRWYGDRHVPPLLPELRPDVDQATSRVRRWRMGRNRRPSALSASPAGRRGRGSLKVFLSERSMRRSAAKQLAGARRLRVAQHPNMRRELKTEGVMADRIRARSVARSLRRFFSPSEYPGGRVAGRLACVYFAVTVLVIVSAIPEGNGDGSLTVGLALVATLPLSLGLLVGQDDSAWMLAGLAVCALVNAFVFWVVFRGDPA
jgi:hypothetical protein